MKIKDLIKKYKIIKLKDEVFEMEVESKHLNKIKNSRYCETLEIVEDDGEVARVIVVARSAAPNLLYSGLTALILIITIFISLYYDKQGTSF